VQLLPESQQQTLLEDVVGVVDVLIVEATVDVLIVEATVDVLIVEVDEGQWQVPHELVQ
jgi:hypothetical protein